MQEKNQIIQKIKQNKNRFVSYYSQFFLSQYSKDIVITNQNSKILFKLKNQKNIHFYTYVSLSENFIQTFYRIFEKRKGIFSYWSLYKTFTILGFIDQFRHLIEYLKREIRKYSRIQNVVILQFQVQKVLIYLFIQYCKVKQKPLPFKYRILIFLPYPSGSIFFLFFFSFFSLLCFYKKLVFFVLLLYTLQALFYFFFLRQLLIYFVQHTSL
eukprot:TRINITY_DN9874_c0_g3_i2.p1 TRINITY_DN9874_c0_g3~~TRINITY_DN9874_c0_g3_i2.p1  ORF type:complete len:212 (+),score=-23.18 TRINITY_DN9874_c0_g3_i2:1384-2019(+)